jgi:elongation factor Ts
MAITAAMVKELRDATGAGMMDAKKALTENDGDMDAAVDWLRTKGLAKAAKKSDRTAAEGLVAVKVEDGTGVAVEVNAETDFVAKNADFQTMVGDIANVALDVADMDELIAAALDEASLDPEIVEKERQVQIDIAKESGKPDAVIEKMIVGRMKKFMSEVTLLGQSFVINPDLTVEAAAKDAGAEILGYVRLEVGEGIEKKEEDFAAEVAKAAQG